MLHIPQHNKQQTSQLPQQLNTAQGVAEAVILAQERVVYLKVDNQILDACALHDIINMTS